MWYPGRSKSVYKCVPLNYDVYSTRVVVLDPGRPDDSLVCTLNTIDLEDKNAASFEALSYCWGSTEEASYYPLTIRDSRGHKHEVPIRPNLRDALQSLRQIMRPRSLWADAVCIDQDSDEEKAFQVANMRMIFARAAQTIAWLGEPTPSSNLIFNGCEELMRSVSATKIAEDFKSIWAKRKETMEDIETVLARFKKEATSKKGTEDNSFNHLPDDAVANFVRVLERAWFSRTWVLQETAVAKKALLQCGDKTVPMVPFLFYATLLGTVTGHGLTTHAGASGSADNSWHERMKAFIMIVSASNRVTTDYAAFSLSTVLSSFRRFECERPVDKLYALLGLVPLETANLGLKPNYSMSTKKVYTDSTFKIIQKSKDLSVLEVPRGNSDLDIPSWVPHWNDTSRFGIGLTPETQVERPPMSQTSIPAKARLDLLARLIKDRAAMYPSDGHDSMESKYLNTLKSDIVDAWPIQRFEASGSTKVAEAAMSQDRILSLQGMVFDTVADVGNVMGDLVGPPETVRSSDELFGHWMKVFETLDEIKSWHKRLAEKDKQLYSTGETKSMAFLQTACTGSLPGRYSTGNHWDTSQDVLDGFWKWLYSWKFGQRSVRLCRKMGKAMFEQDTREGIEVTWQGLITLVFSGKHADGLAQAAAPVFRRRFGVTHKGYFALLPENATSSDSIAILKGGKLPLVVRPCEGHNTFELVGEAYVHGIMFGEAWDDSKCSDVHFV